MDEFIATTKQLKKGGHTKILYMTDESKAFGLDEDDEIFCVFTTVRNKEFILSRLYNTDRNLFFVIACSIDGRLRFHIEKAISEYQIASENKDIVAILGPVDTCDDAHDLLLFLESTDCDLTETSLKLKFRDFRESRRPRYGEGVQGDDSMRDRRCQDRHGAHKIL